MHPRTLLLRLQCVRVLPIRPIRPAPAALYLRAYSFDTSKPQNPNKDAIPTVSEEAAATAKITGETQPEIEQGTPISEVPLPLGIPLPPNRPLTDSEGDQARPTGNQASAESPEE